MTYPPVIVVNEEDIPIGLAMLAEVWDKGLYHRVVRIMAEDGHGRILLQKRSANMTVFPNCWDNSAAGHVDEGMTYETAALQELAEELGVTHQGLAEIGYYLYKGTHSGRIMNQFQKVYRILLDHDPVTKDDHEVAALKWFTIEEAKALVRDHPDQVTPGLKNVFERYYQDAYENHRHQATSQTSRPLLGIR